MSVGIIIWGMLIGAAASVAGLVFGLSFWMAMLIYAGVGTLSVCIWVVVLLVTPKKQPTQVVADS